MIKPSTLDFLKGLESNNDRDWFLANKKNYESAKTNFEETVQEIIDGLCAFDAGIKDQLAKKCVFRIYRDVRFSKNKAPYKNNFGAGISKGGKKLVSAGYYIHLQPGDQSFLAGGIWMPEPPVLNALRQEIDYNTDEFMAILNHKDFKKQFGQLSDAKLKTAPKNYAKDHPHIELLKYTSYIVERNIKDKEVTGKNFVKNTVATFKALHPMNEFLNRVLEA
jgi:uncharacterized protein (TIGR02453 family)